VGGIVVKTCPNCQTINIEGANVCWNCGQTIRQSWWRRILDVLDTASAARTVGTNDTEADEETVAKLVVLLEDESESVRGDAALALAKIANKDPEVVREAIPKLIILLGDEDEHTRGFAARALGTVGAEEALEPLRKLLGDDAGSGIGMGSSFRVRELTIGEVAREAIERIEER